MDIVRLLGPISTLAFGAWGVGAKTRDDTGRLTAHGRAAIIGLVVSCAVAVVSQWYDVVGRAEAAKREAAKYEALLKMSLYGSLGTTDALLDFGVGITLEDLRRVDPAYADRLARAFDRSRACRLRPSGVWQVSSTTYDCQDHERIEHKVFGPQITFKKSSRLLPDEKDEPLARALISWMAVEFVVESADKAREYAGGRRLFVDPYLEAATFIFDGTHLGIWVRDQPIDRSFLASANVTSMVDLLGRTMTVTATGVVPPAILSANSERVGALRETLAQRVMLLRFALKFPHRRDIILAPPELRGFIKTAIASNLGIAYEYRFPDRVEDLPVNDRTSVTGR